MTKTFEIPIYVQVSAESATEAYCKLQFNLEGQGFPWHVVEHAVWFKREEHEGVCHDQALSQKESREAIDAYWHGE